MKTAKTTTDALQIMEAAFYHGRPQRQAALEKARADDAVARQLYELRTQAGLSQRELAGRVGTTASVICRLENADYEGHSLSMLNRVAACLNQRVEIRFVPLRRSRRAVAAA